MCRALHLHDDDRHSPQHWQVGHFISCDCVLLLGKFPAAVYSTSKANVLKYMLIFGGTINVVPWVYVRIGGIIFRTFKNADVYTRDLKSYHWRQELEELPSQSLLIGCGVSISVKPTDKPDLI